jgi:hypothetical protein
MMTKGFAPPTEIKTKKFWLAAFTQDNEDDPFKTVRLMVPRKSTESAIKHAVKAGKKWMDTDDSIWEVLIHDGPDEIPSTGDAILARLSREQFKESTELTGAEDWMERYDEALNQLAK